MIGGAKRILRCSLRTCNEAVRVTWGWIHYRVIEIRMVVYMPEHRYSRKLFVQEWNVKPRRGCKVVDNLFSSLGLDKAEWIRKGI